MRKYIFLVVLFLPFITIQAQELSISYKESVYGVPVINIPINGKDYKFLFDTGSFKTVINSEVFPNLQILGQTDVEDSNDVKKKVDLVKFSFNFLNRYFRDKEVLYMNLSSIPNIGCSEHVILSGVIGMDIIEDYIVEINPSDNNIVFHNHEKFNEDQISDFIKVKLEKTSKPLVPLKIGNQKRYVVFDTGSNGTLTVSDFKLQRYINTTIHTAYTSLGSSYGAHGINVNKDLRHEIYDGGIQLGKLNVKNQKIETSRNNINNMGFRFISQFISYLDMKDKVLYLKQINKHAYGESSLKNLGFYIRYDAEQKKNIIVTLSTKNDKLKLGDNLISINGETPPENNCDMYSFLKKFFSTPIKIKLERENKIIEIEQTAQDKNF